MRSRTWVVPRVRAAPFSFAGPLILVASMAGCLGGDDGGPSANSPVGSKPGPSGPTEEPTDPTQGRGPGGKGGSTPGELPGSAPANTSSEVMFHEILAYDLADERQPARFALRPNTTRVEITIQLNVTASGAYGLIPDREGASPATDFFSVDSGGGSRGGGSSGGTSVSIAYPLNYGLGDEGETLAGPLAATIQAPTEGAWHVLLDGLGTNEEVEIWIVAYYI